MRKEEGAILLAHGSSSPDAEEGFEEIASQVRAGLGGRRVILAFLQFNHPNLAEGISQGRRSGTPLFTINRCYGRIPSAWMEIPQ